MTTAEPPTLLAPAPAGRITAIDTLRGVAVLGILLINILSFGLPAAAGDDPTVYGGAEGADLVAWFVGQVFFEGKMRALFSFLFGASALLLTAPATRRSTPEEMADVYIRRTLWLTAFGYLHYYLLWEGDILYEYGVAGVLLFPFRRLRPVALLVLGAAVLAATVLLAAIDSWEVRALQEKADEASAAREAGQALTPRQEQAERDWREKREEIRAPLEKLNDEIEARRGDYGSNFQWRRKQAAGYRAFGEEILDIAGTMFIGMGLFKLGVLSGLRSRRFYVGLALIGFGIGLPLSLAVAVGQIRSDFDPFDMRFLRYATYEAARIPFALGYVAVVMLACRVGILSLVARWLAAVGRMALTNYLMQTVICTTLFYGYGFGLFGELSRAQLYAVVLGVWLVELAWSPLWLWRYQYGPAEWLWRWLTYLRRPPLLRREETPA
jgi:uncharacterized protein